MTPPPPRSRRLRIPPHVAVVAAVFVGVRLIAWGHGLRFDASEAAAFWHFIEPDLLRTRLLESLWHLHAQPPLFNAWLGLMHKAFGEHLAVAFGVAYLGLGVMLAVQLMRLGAVLGVPPWPRALGVAIFCTSPAVLLYEHFLLYAYPVAVLLVWSAVRLARAIASGRERDWWAFVAIVLAIVLMRALYHPLWLGLVLAGVAGAAWRQGVGLLSLRRPAIVAVLIVGALLVRNWVQFGQPTLSTFAGMNLSRVVLDRMDQDERTALVASGTLSPWAATGAFRPLTDYVPSPLGPATGVPLLDRAFKADGAVNFHHRAYVEISARLARDSLVVIRARPGVYVASVRENLWQMLRPASTYAPLTAARARIAPLVRAYEPMMGWPRTGSAGVWPVLLPLLWLAAAARLWEGRGRPDAGWVVTAYLLGTVAWVVAAGAALERTENQRFRFDVDPFIWVLLLIAVHGLWRRIAPLEARS